MNLYQKILLLEQQFLSQRLMIDRNFDVLGEIKQILSQLDIDAEVPNAREFRQICELLEDLKEEALTAEELDMVHRILSTENTEHKSN